MLPSVEQRIRGSASPATVSGIIERFDGERAIPESKRADGTRCGSVGQAIRPGSRTPSVRKERKVRPGFTPVEDVGKYRSARQAEHERLRPPGYVPGLPLASTSYAGAPMTKPSSSANGPLSKSAKKNAARVAKRREAKEGEEEGSKEEPIAVPDDWDDEDGASAGKAAPVAAVEAPKPKPPREARPSALFASALAAATGPSADDADPAKRARALQKKLRQAEQLRDRASRGDVLLPEQASKVETIASLEEEIAKLAVHDDADDVVY